MNPFVKSPGDQLQEHNKADDFDGSAGGISTAADEQQDQQYHFAGCRPCVDIAHLKSRSSAEGYGLSY